MVAEGAKLTSGIDWKSVRERMAAAVRRTEEALEPPSRRTDRVLKERARALAAMPAKLDNDDQALDVIPFGLRGSPYLIESRYVREILQAPAISPVPRAADFLIGVTNIRGELVPVFDLPNFFGLPAASAPSGDRLAVLGEQHPEFAILVEWIEPAMEIAHDMILTEEAGPGADRKHIRGLTADGRPILDGEALLSEPRLFLTS